MCVVNKKYAIYCKMVISVIYCAQQSMEQKGGMYMPIPLKNKEEKPRTAKERVYTAVREWIIDGTLQPGEQIIDQEIAEYFSVSRTPVREAIQMLADQKLVEIQPGKATRVTDISLEEAMSNYRVAAELSALALEMAYPHISDTVLDELLHIDHDFDIAGRSRNVKAAVALDEQFNHRIFELAGNYFLGEFARILESHSQRVENIYFSQNDEMNFQSHQGILAALKRKDLPAAKEAMRRNWMHTVELLKEKQ